MKRIVILCLLLMSVLPLSSQQSHVFYGCRTDEGWVCSEKENGVSKAIDSFLFGIDSMWESWDGERSRVHNCYNGVGIWFYQALAGLRPNPEHPGYEHFFVYPQPCKGVEWKL